MTKQEARERIEGMLGEWRTVGEVARKLNIPRGSVEREVRRMDDLGMLESEERAFWRNGGQRAGRVYRVAALECAPVGSR